MIGETYQSIVVNAPIDNVWAVVRDFTNLSWAEVVVETYKAVGDKAADQVGAQRVINDAFEETLQGIDDYGYCLRYSIDDGPSPVSSRDVSGYSGTVQLHRITEGDATFVEWSSRWEADNPDAEEFCHEIYVGLLRALKQHFERD